MTANLLQRKSTGRLAMKANGRLAQSTAATNKCCCAAAACIAQTNCVHCQLDVNHYTPASWTCTVTGVNASGSVGLCQTVGSGSEKILTVSGSFPAGLCLPGNTFNPCDWVAGVPLSGTLNVHTSSTSCGTTPTAATFSTASAQLWRVTTAEYSAAGNSWVFMITTTPSAGNNVALFYGSLPASADPSICSGSPLTFTGRSSAASFTSFQGITLIAGTTGGTAVVTPCC